MTSRSRWEPGSPGCWARTGRARARSSTCSRACWRRQPGRSGSAVARRSATRRVYSMVGLVPEREAVPGYLTGRQFVRSNAELQSVADVVAATETADRDRRHGRCGGPPDPHLLEGHAPAHQARGGPRPRPADPAPRRTVQRHGPAPAAAHDGAAPADGGRGPGDPLLVAHPRGGRAPRRSRARRLRRAARRVG